MFHSTDLFLVSIFAIFMGVESLPAAEVHAVFSEVIPGPGLPSLASLGITSEQLHTMPPEFHPLVPRAALYDPFCTGTRANVDDVIACFNYLVNIGDRTCEAFVFARMCTSGTATIMRYGGELFGFDSKNACYNCALAGQWDFTNCNNGGQVNGRAASYGNGNLIIGVEHAYV